MDGGWLRPLLFVGVLLALLALESRAAPRLDAAALAARRASPGAGRLDAVLLRLTLPLLTGAAALAEARGWGLLRALSPPAPLAGMLSLLLLDLAIWRSMSRCTACRCSGACTACITPTPTLGTPARRCAFTRWRSGCRCSGRSCWCSRSGAPVAAVAGFELLLSACALFNHANLALPAPVDAWLRRVLITPDVHRIHHSIHRDETDSNFGFSVVRWDHLFGTWRSAPRDGHATMTIGLTVSAPRTPSASARCCCSRCAATAEPAH